MWGECGGGSEVEGESGGRECVGRECGGGSVGERLWEGECGG